MKNEIQKTEYLLAPGYIIVPEDPTLIYMIMGSSVSVVIFNRGDGRAGCCHFVLPKPPTNEKPRATHGTAAILTLINILIEQGGTVNDLEAQVIGGSDLPGRQLGKENVDMAVKVLKKKGVHIASQDVGGDKGRKLIFNTDTNNIAVIKVDKIRSSDWYPHEAF